MTKKMTALTLAKPTLIAGAVLAMTAGLAHAQSNVTIFGRIDTGVEYISKFPTAGGDDSRISLQNGGILPSIWGFRGSEDLGGGLKAVFNLESDFSSDTGGERFGGALRIFGRQANVGLSGGFGTVLLGRQYSPALLADLGTEPRGFKESYSSLLSYAFNQAPSGNAVTGNNFLGIFNGNMISYSNAFGPVNVGVGYGFGEQAGNQSQGSTTALGASYTGPVTVSGSYQQIKAIGSDAKTKRYSLGVAVPFGDFTFKGYFANAKGEGPLASDVFKTDNFGVGADFRWNAQNTANVTYYYGKDKNVSDDKTKTLVVSNDYALSKRTTLYAQLVYVDADSLATARTQVSGDRFVLPGEKSTIFGAGIKHDF